MTPLVSIVIPTYNSEATLDGCLQSIVRQTYPHKEVVVIDGLSKDNTIPLLRKYEAQYPFITHFAEKDRGIYDAMNKGIDKAKGDYLFFLGSDDCLYSDTVLGDVFFNAAIGNADFIYGNVFFRHAKRIYSGESSIEKLMGEQISICHQAIFYKKEIFERIGKYDLRYFVHADYDLNVRCFENPSVKAKYLDTTITLYNERGTSGLQPNKDGFHDWLTLHYINKYATPFDLIVRIKNLKEELDGIKNSKAYKLGNAVSQSLAKARAFKQLLLKKRRF